jgi:polyhydroxyalkanoate synthesis repressor PhaR
VTRHVKRYGNRKLYDATESRYVSLTELAGWIAAGQRVEVTDNQSGEDVTVQVLTQLISEQGRRGRSFPSALLHDLIRVGEEALQAGEEVVATRVRRIQETAGQVAQVVQQQVDRLKQPSDIEHKMDDLRRRLDDLEARLDGAAQRDKLTKP